EGSLLSGIMHNFDNQLGLTVENGLGRRWRAFGDDYLNNLGPAQRKLLDGMTQTIEARSDANRDYLISAMGAAMKQLHYQAQRHFGDRGNAAEFQAVPTGTRGRASGLLYDDAVFDSAPGDGSATRDAWIAMDIPAKIAYMRKHQPLPVTDGT